MSLSPSSAPSFDYADMPSPLGESENTITVLLRPAQGRGAPIRWESLDGGGGRSGPWGRDPCSDPQAPLLLRPAHPYSPLVSHSGFRVIEGTLAVTSSELGVQPREVAVSRGPYLRHCGEMNSGDLISSQLISWKVLLRVTQGWTFWKARAASCIGPSPWRDQELGFFTSFSPEEAGAADATVAASAGDKLVCG